MISPKKSLLSGQATNSSKAPPPQCLINSTPKPAPWIGLPFELISIIVSYADDPLTLRNLQTAALHNRALYNAVVLHQWARVKITAQDLLSSPSERLSRPERRAQTSLIQAATTRTLHGILPAHHIRTLTIDFNNTRLKHSDRLPGPLATGESLEHSLDKLLPHLQCVRKINLLGDAPQELIDSIVKSIPGHNIDSLKIRLEREDPGRFSTPGRREKCQQSILQLEKLSQLRGLRELEVWGLKQQEAASLAKALSQLPSLRKLVVATDSTWDCMLLPIGNAKSPLDTFFQHVFQSRKADRDTETHCGLPTTLKSLELHDYYCSSSQGIEAVPSDHAPTFDALNNAYFDLDSIGNIHKLLRWLSGAHISRLVLPGTFCSNRCRSLFLRSEYEPDPTYIGNLNPLISAHQRDLSEVTLIDAWDTHQLLADDLNKTWEGKFAIQELVLGTKSPSFYELGPCGVRANWHLETANTIHNNFYGYTQPYGHTSYGATGRWGSELRRARLDQVSFTGLQVSNFANPHLANLVVLVLSHSPTSSASSMLPYAMSTIPEARLAARLAAQDFPKLRLLAIGPYQFWVQRFRAKPNSTALRHKLWHAVHARADPIQGPRMQALLSKRDWDFVNEGRIDVVKRKSVDGELRSGSRGCKMPVSGNVSAIELREKNYMVLERIA